MCPFPSYRNAVACDRDSRVSGGDCCIRMRRTGNVAFRTLALRGKGRSGLRYFLVCEFSADKEEVL
jgi:hypothetical protein